MQKQELTLFGGWARVRTRWQTENGVTELSDMLSASIFLKNTPDFSWDPHYSLFTGPKSTLPPGESTEKPFQYTISAVYMTRFEDVTWYQERKIPRITEHARLLCQDLGAYSFEEAITWRNLVYDLLTYRAIVRYFEIWGKGTLKRIMFALCGTPRLSHVFRGMIGCNNRLDKHGRLALVKLDTGIWQVKDLSALYPRIKRLPPTGIACARALAKKLYEQRTAR